MDFVEAAKKHFIEIDKKYGEDRHFTLLQHVPIVVKWAQKIAKDFPEADQEVLSISAWLHDVGDYIGDCDDHAVSSEQDAEKFLSKIGYNKIEEVKHCIRAHRCRDILPESIEARLLAFADSASHLSDLIYLDIFRMWGRDVVLEKIERDWRDVNKLPQGKELEKLYMSWKNLIQEMPEWVFDKKEEQKIAMRYVENS